MAETKIKDFSKLGAEFLGTYVLVSVVALSIALGSTDDNLAKFTPFAIASALMTMVYALGPISGGHLNPAVTFAVWLSKQTKGKNVIDEEDKEALKYIAAQCAGGALAGLTSFFVFGGTDQDIALGPKKATFTIGAPLVEFFYTFMLCFVVLNTAVVKTDKPKHFFGLAIGFVIIAGGYAGGQISGAAFNPAVTLGLQFMQISWKVFWLPIYVVVQFAAAFAATTALHLVRPETKMPEQEFEWKISKLIVQLEGMFDPEDTSEFLGSFFLSLTITLNGVAAVAGSVWSIAASLMCMIYAVGDVSGGLFNPALTVAFLLRWLNTKLGFSKDGLRDPKADDKAYKEGFKYILAQSVGAAAGAGATILIYLFDVVDLPGHWPIGQLKATNNLPQAMVAEFYGTFLLCFVVLAVASTTKTPKLEQYAPFCIGGTIVAGGYAFGPLSGGIMNPAITLANAIGHQFQVIYTLAPLAYIASQFLGGIFAALVFKFITHVHEYDPASALQEPLRSNEAN